MNIETKTEITLNTEESTALAELLTFLFEEVSCKKRNNFFDVNVEETLQDMYMSL